MDDLSDRIDFLLEDLVRLDVARACETSARTKSQIAHELKREPGSLSAVVTLEKRRALVKVGRAPARGKRPGGERWQLDPAWVPAVRTAEADAWAGRLSTGLDLVLIPLPETQAACDALVSGDAAAAWGIPLRGEQMGLLLCPSSSADDAATLRLVSTLAKWGVHGVRLHVDRVLPGRELQSWARSIATAGPAQLPPPVT
jgi:hypothetical protein